MRTLSRHVVLLALWCATACYAADVTPAAKTSTPPNNPAPQPQSHAPATAAVSTANDDACRLATRDSAGAASCISSADADHDGVSDGQDQCPDTTPGVAVDATGCAARVPEQ